MRGLNPTQASHRQLTGFTLLALGLATGLLVVSCQDQRSVTEAPHAPRADATVAPATVVISPTTDTYLNINATNNVADVTLNVYTWPDTKSANVIVMKFDLASIPAGSTISSATLSLNLTVNDASADPTYRFTAYKIVNKNTVLTIEMSYTYYSVKSWTCYS